VNLRLDAEFAAAMPSCRRRIAQARTGRQFRCDLEWRRPR
jgi:hypothetical protein